MLPSTLRLVLTSALLGAFAVLALPEELHYSKALDSINPDNWPATSRVPSDIMLKAVLVVSGGGDGDGKDVLVHTSDKKTYVYAAVIGNGEVAELRGLKFIDAKIGQNVFTTGIFFVLLSENGEVYAAGNNVMGQLGQGYAGGVISKFNKVPGLQYVAKISAGEAHTLALTHHGQVYFMGEVPRTDPTPTPKLVNFHRPDFIPAQIASGWSHCLVLSQDGKTVMGWGINSRGQLGNGVDKEGAVSVYHPVAANFPEGVRLGQIFAGYATSFALSVEGRLWSWGHDYRGALGIDGADHLVPTSDIPGINSRAVVAFRTWWWASVAVTSDQEVFVWGSFKDGLIRKQPTLIHNAPSNPLDLLADAYYTATAGAATVASSSQTACPCGESLGRIEKQLTVLVTAREDDATKAKENFDKIYDEIKEVKTILKGE